MRYIRLAVREAHLARVPNQLVSDKGEEEVGSEDGVENDVNEISGCGAAMGYTGPLGSGRRIHKNKRNQ